MAQNSVLNDSILRAQCNFRRTHCAGLFFLGGVYSGEIVRASYEFDARSVYMFIHDMEHNILPHPVPFTAYSSCGTENFPKPRTGDNAHFKLHKIAKPNNYTHPQRRSLRFNFPNGGNHDDNREASAIRNR